MARNGDGLSRPFNSRTSSRSPESRRQYIALGHGGRHRELGLMAALIAAVMLFAVTLASIAKPLNAQRSSRQAQFQHPPADIDYFVRVVDGKFVVGPECKPFYISGWNQWETMEAAGGALELFGASLPDNTTGPALVRSLLDKAQAQGLNVLRAWSHPVSAPYALQSGPGAYNEAVFRGLDYLIDEARKRGIRLLLALTDNWQAVGGADQFLTWAGKSVHEDFFSDPIAKQYYKDHVKILLERRNTINGRLYKDDPAIFAFDLINEPRCFRCGNLLEEWISEMAAWVKSIDPNHLLTVGEEGFYPEEGASAAQMAANPQGMESWAFWEGQHFQKDHASPLIDFAAIHLWIHNWEDATEEFARKWLQQHIQDAQEIGKPLLVEEFGAWGVGKYREERTKWYELVYGILTEDAKSGGPTMGALFWQWFAAGQRAPAEEGGGDGGLFGVFDYEGTWSAVAKFTAQMQELNQNSGSGTCGVAQQKVGSTQKQLPSSLLSIASAPAVPDCSYTQIDGQEGTGFEGPKCDIDINECARGTARCDPNAACINDIGGYRCACFAGYTGDGKSCTPGPGLYLILAGYKTLGMGKLSCNEGTDIVFPVLGPGYADDVMDALPGHKDSPWKGGVGSRVPVSAQQCMIACTTAPGCDSFTYNAEQRRCFLKSGPSSEICQKPETLCVSARGSPYSCGYWQTYYNASLFQTVGAPSVLAAEGPPGSTAKGSTSIRSKIFKSRDIVTDVENNTG